MPSNKTSPSRPVRNKKRISAHYIKNQRTEYVLGLKFRISQTQEESEQMCNKLFKFLIDTNLNSRYCE